VDTFLLADTVARGTIREIHPEVLFWALNCGKAMKHNKRTNEGFSERVGVIERYSNDYADILKGKTKVNINLLLSKKQGYTRDDVVDAFCSGADC